MDKNQIAVSIFNKLAKRYEAKYMDVSLYSKSLDFFCASVMNESATVLDLACGPGNVAKYLLNKRSDFDLLGLDLSEEMVELAEQNNPTAKFIVSDCRKIASLENQYDGIVCAFLFPYLTKDEVIQLIADASTKISPQGIFYISTMEDDYSKSHYQKGSSGDEIFMHFHEADYLIEALEVSGFELILTDRVFTDHKDDSRITDLILIGKKVNDKSLL